jgi:glycosyltransferase involved in cell wall biosynthesis
VLHSVYEHRDKTICTAALKNVICHTEAGRDCLRRLGYSGRVAVIPHGCVELAGEELWNIYQTPYCLVQFGFGFDYKGVEVALEALALLKGRDDRKYEDVFFTYLCSETPHTSSINSAYSRRLEIRKEELGLSENVAILRGYQSEASLYNFLQTNKIAIFPYQSDPKNVVYGASGAIRLALANRVPTIASSSPMFADLEGVVPRPSTAAELAREIDKVFSDGDYRQSLIVKASEYAKATTWKAVAAMYAREMRTILDERAATRTRMNFRNDGVSLSKG